MSNNEYSRSLTTGAIAHVEGESLVIDGPAHLDGSTLVIDSVNFLPQEVDYTDNDSVKMRLHKAAALYGYSDPNYVSTLFKRYNGHSITKKHTV